jgi:hypothetical protein
MSSLMAESASEAKPEAANLSASFLLGAASRHSPRRSQTAALDPELTFTTGNDSGSRCRFLAIGLTPSAGQRLSANERQALIGC